METVKAKTEDKMKKSVAALGEELGAIRTGRASASLFDKISVSYFGKPTPLNQVATISIPEARLVVIQPWDAEKRACKTGKVHRREQPCGNPEYPPGGQ